MAYFCFIEGEGLSVPHMEPLDAETAEDARREALRLLARHSSGRMAHVYFDDEPVCSLAAETSRAGVGAGLGQGLTC